METDRLDQYYRAVTGSEDTMIKAGCPDINHIENNFRRSKDQFLRLNFGLTVNDDFHTAVVSIIVIIVREV